MSKIVNIGYLITSLWAIFAFMTIVTDSYYSIDLTSKSYGYLIGGTLGLIFYITTPLGIVFALDRHFKNKKQKELRNALH